MLDVVVAVVVVIVVDVLKVGHTMYGNLRTLLLTLMMTWSHLVLQ